MKKALFIGVLGVMLSASGLAVADQESPALDALFKRLGATTDSKDAAEIEREIWRIWGVTDKDQVNGIFSMGVLMMTHGSLNDARRQFDRVVALAPRFAEGWNKRATLFYMMGDFDASVRDIQRTLTLEPRHFGALSGLSLIYEALGEDEKALDVLVQVKEIYPGMPEIDARMQALRDALANKKI